jgi:ABC-type Na+ efflux pump permease subunit
MIYLKIIHATMKIKIQTIRVSFWIILGIAILLTNLALNRTSGMLQESTATPAIQADTVVATEEARNEAGSTNWIMLMAVVIVLIVIIPILLKRQAWENGKRNKTAPPG